MGVTISELYDQKAEEVPDQIDAITRSRNSFVNEIQACVFNFRTLIASNMPDEPRPVQPGNPNPQAGAKEYTIPEFNGKVMEKEWGQCVATGREEAWQLIKFSKRVPKKCDLALMEMITEAWEKSDSLYATPSVMSNKVIKEFLDTEPRQVKGLHCKLTELYINLKTVNQLEDNYGIKDVQKNNLV